MKLTSNNVIQCMQHCLANKDDSDGVMYKMVAHSFMLSTSKVEKCKDDIIEMLAGLPEEFHEDSGGGWSFLMACNDKDDKQWTGMHLVVEQLFCLGMAARRVKFLMPRELWKVLPGGVPYILVTKEDISDEDMNKTLIDDIVEGKKEGLSDGDDSADSD